MKIMSSGGETVEVPKEYEEVVRKNINNPDYINSLVQGFKSGGSWKPNKKPYKYSERARINEVTQMTYGGMNDHLSVYPMAMQKGGVSDPYFPNSDGQFTNDRLSNFINMVQGSAQKAMVKELAKQGMESGILPPGPIMQSGGTPYQNGLTAGTGWLARHGGSHLPKAQAGNFGWGYPYAYGIGFGKSTYYPPLNLNPITYSTNKEIAPGTQVTGVDVKGKGRSFTLDVNVPQDDLNIANQVQLQPSGNQQDWSTSSFNGPTDQAGNQIQTPDYSNQTPPTMDPAQNSRLAVTPYTPGYYKADKIKVKRNSRLSGQQKAMLMNTGMETVTNFANRIDEAKKEEQLRQKRTADYLFDPIQGNRGDYTPNYGYFRPDQMVPVQYQGAAGSYAQYGGSQDDGVYMTEDEIQQILANGGEIEYLD
jgi:hypothetical protein